MSRIGGRAFQSTAIDVDHETAGLRIIGGEGVAR